MADLLLHVANFSTLFVCLWLKIPHIILLLMRDASTAGISPNRLLLNLMVLVVVLTYQMYYDYPATSYMEYPALIAIQIIILSLVLHQNGILRHGVIYTMVFVAGWRLLIAHTLIVDLAMSLCTFISASTKFGVLLDLWTSKDSGKVSALSWGLCTYTYMARIYTTIVTTGDMQVLVRFVVLTLFDLWVLLTVFHYRRSSSPKKGDRAQPQQAQERGPRRSQTRPKGKSR